MATSAPLVCTITTKEVIFLKKCLKICYADGKYDDKSSRFELMYEPNVKILLGHKLRNCFTDLKRHQVRKIGTTLKPFSLNFNSEGEN